MRKFSELEKNYIQELVKNSNNPEENLPIKILDKLFQENFIEFNGNDASNPYLLFWCKQEDFSENKVKAIISVCNKIYEVSFLIDYLSDNGLARKISYNKEKDLKWNDGNDYAELGLKSFQCKIDDSVASVLIECINCSVYVSQTLKDLVDNNFKSLDEKALDEAKKQTKLAKCTALFALITIIVSIFLTKCSVSLDENQNLFRKPINVIDTSLSNILNDSLNVHMNEMKNLVFEIRNHQSDTLNVKCTSGKRKNNKGHRKP